MASKLMILTAATMFLGDDNPDESLHLSLTNFKIPALTAQTKDHMAGGAMMGLKINMGIIEPLEFTFKLAGINREAMSKFMNPAGPINYTVRGNLRDINLQEDVAILAVIKGVMTSTDMSEYSRDGGVDSDYKIDEVTAYRLYIGGVEKHYFDWAQGPAGVRVDGIPIFNNVARNLGLI